MAKRGGAATRSLKTCGRVHDRVELHATRPALDAAKPMGRSDCETGAKRGFRTAGNEAEPRPTSLEARTSFSFVLAGEDVAERDGAKVAVKAGSRRVPGTKM